MTKIESNILKLVPNIKLVKQDDIVIITKDDKKFKYCGINHHRIVVLRDENNTIHFTSIGKFNTRFCFENETEVAKRFLENKTN